MLAILLEIDCCLFSRFERIKALEVIIWKSQRNGNFNVKFQIHLFVSKSADCLPFFYHCRFTTMDPDLDAKRALQDFSLLHQCLTNELWQTIWNLQHYQKEEGVLNYAFDLGLRCPSGSTIQCMTALIHLVDMKSLSAGELYIRQRKVSNAFRALRIGLEKQMGMTKDVIRTLDPSDVANAIPCQVPNNEWAAYIEKNPLRQTHHKVQVQNVHCQKDGINFFEFLARMNASFNGMMHEPEKKNAVSTLQILKPPSLCDHSLEKDSSAGLPAILDQDQKISEAARFEYFLYFVQIRINLDCMICL